METDTQLFFSDLPLHNKGLDNLLSNEANFTQVPPDWHIVITDIKNSTKAVAEGHHQTVNFLATGSIVTVLNIAGKKNLNVPFFFGCDGATFIVPHTIITEVMESLASYKANTLTNFNLEIRTCKVPVEMIYRKGLELKIARHSRSSVFSIPVVLGNGLSYAEKLAKEDDYTDAEMNQCNHEPDLSGMQCRWSKIAPPVQHEEVVALLVVARNGVQQSAIFRKVMQQIDVLYGAPKQRQPISVIKLRLKTTYNSFKTAILAKSGKFNIFLMFGALLASVYGFFYLHTLKGKRFLEQLVAMSDTLVIDGKINTVISGTAVQRQELERLLLQMESAGEIFFGLHGSSASIMSCYVRNMDDAHVHFVDGAEGGYTEAARILKSKLRRRFITA